MAKKTAKKTAKRIAKKSPRAFEGWIGVVNVKGRDTEASHTSQFGMVSATNLPSETFLLDASRPVKYRALLRQVIDACLDLGLTTVDPKLARDTLFADRITTVQDGVGRKASRRKMPAGRPRAGDAWSFIGKVTCLHAGTSTARSRFTLRNGDNTANFVLDSKTNPRRAAAMFDLVAAAFGAGALLRVNDYVARGKRIAIEIEMGPLS